MIIVLIQMHTSPVHNTQYIMHVSNTSPVIAFIYSTGLVVTNYNLFKQVLSVWS